MGLCGTEMWAKKLKRGLKASQLGLLNRMSCLLSQHFPKCKSLIHNQSNECVFVVGGGVAGKSGQHHTFLKPCYPGKETIKKVTNQFWDADSSQGVKMGRAVRQAKAT